MRELKDLIVAAQNSDKQSMMELLTYFEPIINKYTRRMRNDEDFKSDITIYLIELINEIKLSKFRIPNDYAIINYVKNSLYHQYICLSKKSSVRRVTENNYESEDLDEWIGVDTSFSDTINDFLMDDVLRNTLTEREYSCIKLMVLDGLSSTQAANILGITRQSANEAKIRALTKLKRLLIN